MRLPLTLYCYSVSPSKQLETLLRLAGLRVCLFFFTTSWRYSGCSLMIALLLLLVGTSGQPLSLSPLEPIALLVWVSRLVSILTGSMWVMLSLCQWLLRWMQSARWKQEMQGSENALRHRISILEDWLVFSSPKTDSKVIKVRLASLD